MGESNTFAKRSITVVGDLSRDEQYFLYEKTRELKRGLLSGDDVSRFRLRDSERTIYLLFLEDSTRTKESFRNAAKFHGTKVNDFAVSSSSIVTKKESITDTVKMLFGYSERSMFIVRSKMEGVCGWLHTALGEYARRIGKEPPSFINAGDGKHEHPTQEFLDEFTFLEHRNWDRQEIHVALIGDLHHGRTVHSKVDGLKVFDRVHVDLVAPKELALPEHYRSRMVQHGFTIRTFPSIDSYLDATDVADIWYFTRLQLERMGESVRERAEPLRRAVTCTPTQVARLPAGTRFYHPLPRHRERPTIPAFLDDTDLNGWDAQSINGYYTRIVELGLLGGVLGCDFSGTSWTRQEPADDFIEETLVRSGKKPEHKVGIKPVDNGIVIDHIGRGRDVERIWNQIDKIRHIMGLNCRSSHGVYHSSSPDRFKGIISLPDILAFDERQIKMLGAIAPGCTVNIIKQAQVKKKYRLLMPPRVYNFDEISCKNDACISFRENYQHVRPEFLRAVDLEGTSTFVCKYCDRPHEFEEIWDV